MKRVLSLILFIAITASTLVAQEKSNAAQFWSTLQKHCGSAYEGVVAESAGGTDSFSGKKLVMHVRVCDDKTIRIPFFVGDDKSRTWVLRFENDRIELKHDHRHEDGTEDKVTQYGGTASNSGLASVQVFAADSYTAALIPAAAANVWWITVNETDFTYNLRRLGSDRVVSVKFDLRKKVSTPPAPWGAKE